MSVRFTTVAVLATLAVAASATSIRLGKPLMDEASGNWGSYVTVCPGQSDGAAIFINWNTQNCEGSNYRRLANLY